jgi:hypothetical protein
MLVHSGSTSEVLQQLAEYGLDETHVDCFFGGLAKNCELAQSWLDARRRLEQSSAQSAESN